MNINIIRPMNVTITEVQEAWKSVRKAGGACGLDRQTISDIELDWESQIYKIWNRLSSGTYMAKPVLLVSIPKAKGGTRQLGIPTVCDRIAQMVIKNRLEKILEEVFHEDSYAYRPNKSAIDAVTVCRERCFKNEWLIEIDIKAFFDNLDHEILMDILSKYTDDKVILLYCKRFIKANGMNEEGVEISREKGTPQGGVVSPILANLYLHEAFDLWMRKNYNNISFERYADDIVVHAKNEKQANFIKDKIRERLKEYKLEMHPEKSKIIYTGKSNDLDLRKHNLSRRFTFLGYDFKPRYNRGKIVFTPAIGSGALKIIRDKIKKEWGLRARISENLRDIAKEVDVKIRGWINYYGHHRRSELYKLAAMIDNYLVKFIKKKHKTTNTWKKAWTALQIMKANESNMFSHWHMISPANRRAV